MDGGNLNRDVDLRGLSLDSRTTKPGDLFFAIDGERVNGFSFVQDALKRGAVAILAGNNRKVEEIPLKHPLFFTSDPAFAAGVMAKEFYGTFKDGLELWGVTGTNGKTTVTYILESILRQDGGNPGVIGTINIRSSSGAVSSNLTTPDTLTLHRTIAEMRRAGSDTVLLEVSSHAVTQKRVAGCTFDIAIFTNLSHDHLDYHRDMEEYFLSKSLLFTKYTPGVSVINLDDPYGSRLMDMAVGQKISYGFSEKADVKPLWFYSDLKGINMKVSTPDYSLHIFSKLKGKHNAYNILASVAAAYGAGINPGRIMAGVESLTSVPGRLEEVCPGHPVKAFVDYAHTPDALKTVLQSLRCSFLGKLICVVGCGGDRDREKRPVMGKIAAENADVVFFTSDNPRSESAEKIIEEMQWGISKKRAGLEVYSVTDRISAIKKAVDKARPGDIVLVAGKGHEDYQIQGGIRRHLDDREELLNALKNSGDQKICVKSIGKAYTFQVLRAGDLIGSTGGKIVQGELSASFSDVSTDSRTVKKGEVFWALSGERFDGGKFVPEVLQKGAAGVVVNGCSGSYLDLCKGKEQFVIEVKDTLEALGSFAAWRSRRLGLKVLGITGSCGKTSVKELVASIFKLKFNVLKTQGNFNNLIGLPMTLLKAVPEHQWAILEMGMNVPGEIARLCEIASPCSGVITNIEAAHLEGLGGVEDVSREKAELWKWMPSFGSAVVNLDNEWCLKAAQDSGLKNITAFTLNQDFTLSRVQSILSGTVRLVKSCGYKVLETCTEIKVDTGEEVVEVKSPLVGKANVLNVLCSAASALANGVEAGLIKKGVETASAVPGRSLLISLNGVTLIDDTYNANPASVAAAIDTLVSIKGAKPSMVIMGDMLELGPETSNYHHDTGSLIARSGVDLLVCVGEQAPYTAEGARESGMREDRILEFKEMDQLLWWINEKKADFFGKNTLYTALIKGSRGMTMELAVEKIRSERKM